MKRVFKILMVSCFFPLAMLCGCGGGEPAEKKEKVDKRADVATFGVRATLVTSAKTPEDMVYAVTREIFENLEEFKKLHPAYAALTRENMLEGLTAPFHPGALRYYKEAGCLPPGTVAPTGVLAKPEGKKRFATIGTGGMTGVYYPTGQAIAKMLNKKSAVYGLRVTAESTGGSVFNINAILQGDLEFGVAQSDRQFQAIKGLAEWKEKGAQSELRAVFSIHPEAVTLVAADDAGIKTIADLRGKRVNIGSIGSGQRQNALDALAAAGIDPEKDIQPESVKAAEAPGLLQDDRIDAFFYTVGHPSGAIKEATSGRRKVHFVALTDLGDILKEHPYYTRAAIDLEHYPQATNGAVAE